MSGAEGGRTPAWDGLAVLAAKAVVGLVVLRAGFYALSDDDFSRVVIAERFAHAPSLDPSGTSWLPAPFYVTGGLMAALGRTLGVARAVGIAEGLAAALLVQRAALLAGVSRTGAALGAVLATAIPTAARLGVSFQPEAVTAGLVVLGAASAAGESGRTRVLGAIALAVAAACRYDAWPAAAAFAALALRDAARGDADRARRPALAAAAVIAAVVPLLWIVHGAVHHGDGLFFLTRVAAYRRALGETESAGTALAGYPVAFVRAEPELVLGAAAALVVTRFGSRGGPRSPVASLSLRPLGVLGATLAFLVLGRLLDGAPTHHAERTLLPFYAWLAVLAAGAVTRAAGTPAFLRALVAAAVAAAIGARLRGAAPPPSLSPRTDERAIGAAARALLPADARLPVDTTDYGYFAVIAAFGTPERTTVADRRDPREAPLPDAFATAGTLRALVSASGADAIVTERRHWSVAASVGQLAAVRGELALFVGANN